MFDPARLVLLDETAANTKMVRLSGPCARGERLIGRVPQDLQEVGWTPIAHPRAHRAGSDLLPTNVRVPLSYRDRSSVRSIALQIA
jgi:hypothetical protein